MFSQESSLTMRRPAESDPQAKRGPRALAVHRNGLALYVLNRLSNSVSVVDIESERVVHELMMRDPTPDYIRAGRGYLFDAKLSGNGTVSCASCHVDGDRDGLAWDLGDPGGTMFNNGTAQAVHPMKGPLLTQTLRGLAGEKLFPLAG
jgi:cytochrome c peroxidase